MSAPDDSTLREVEELAMLLDATTPGGGPAAGGSPLAATVATVHDGDRPAAPSPAFRATLKGYVMQSASSMLLPIPALNGHRPGLDGTSAAPARLRPARRPSPAAGRRRGLIEFVSLAALTAVIFAQAMGFGGAFAFWQDPATAVPEADRPTAMERVDAGRTGTYPTAGPAGEIGLVTRLAPTTAASVNGGSPIFLSPILAGDSMYMSEEAGSSVSTYDLTSGGFYPGRPVPTLGSNVAVGHGHVYVNEQPRTTRPGISGNLVAIDTETWAEVWRYPLAGAVNAPVLVDGENVYVLDAAGTVHTVDGETGSAVWTATVSVGDVDTGDGHLEPFATFGSAWLAAGEGIVAVTTPFGALSTFDATTGAAGWTFDAPAGLSLGPPVIAGGSVLALARDTTYVSGQGMTDGALWRLDVATGAQRWAWPIPAWDADVVDPNQSIRTLDDPLVLTVDAGQAYVVDLGPRANELAAVSLADGSEVWRVTFDESDTRAPVVAGDTLYLARGDGRITGLSTVDGSERWSLRTGKYGLSTPVVSPDRIATIAADGTLFVLGPAGAGEATPTTGAPAADISGMPPCVAPRLPPEPLPVGTPAHTLRGVTNNGLALADVPTGPVADGETFAAILRTLDAIPACQRADTERELGGFYSDDYYRRIPADVPEAQRQTLYLLLWEPGDDLTLDDLNAPVQLPDGRTALLIYDELRDHGVLLVFVQQDGVWLVDERQWVSRELCTTCG